MTTIAVQPGEYNPITVVSERVRIVDGYDLGYGCFRFRIKKGRDLLRFESDIDDFMFILTNGTPDLLLTRDSNAFAALDALLLPPEGELFMLMSASDNDLHLTDRTEFAKKFDLGGAKIFIGANETTIDQLKGSQYFDTSSRKKFSGHAKCSLKNIFCSPVLVKVFLRVNELHFSVR